jgi:hypothetical protein
MSKTVRLHIVLMAAALLFMQSLALAQNVFPDNGNVGIGTAAPEESLSIFSGMNVNQADDGDGSLNHAIKFGHDDTGEGVASRRVPGGNQWGLDLFTNHFARLSILNNGQIGIGTQSPTRTLEIQSSGDVEIGLKSRDSGGRLWTLQSSGVTGASLDSTFQIIDRTAGLSRLAIDSFGMVTVNVLRITGGADIAEPFETSAALPGTVLVIDERHPGRLRSSDRAYDTKVAGVVSGANGIQPGLTLHQEGAMGSGRNVALSGRVYVLADARHTAIRPGDLLTTSDLPGHCMAARNGLRAHGAILGKAMSGLRGRTGLVLALISLE